MNGIHEARSSILLGSTNSLRNRDGPAARGFFVLRAHLKAARGSGIRGSHEGSAAVLGPATIPTALADRCDAGRRRHALT